MPELSRAPREWIIPASAGVFFRLAGGHLAREWYKQRLSALLPLPSPRPFLSPLAASQTLRTGGYKKLPPSSYQTLCRCCKEFDDKEHMVKVVQVRACVRVWFSSSCF